MASVSGPDRGHGPAGGGSLRRLHARYAERLRTAARWLGVADEARDEAVTRCFAGLGEAVPEDSAAGWAALMRALARVPPSDPPPAPRGPAEAALLAFLGRRPAPERAVFALAELGGFDAVALAEAIGAPPAAGQARIVGLRRAFAAEPAVIAGGGPAAVLSACLAADRAPPGWRGESLAALEELSRGAAAGAIPRAAIVGAGALAVAVLVVLRPAPPVGGAEAPPEAAIDAPPVRMVPEPEPTPPPIEPPPLLAVPKDIVKKPEPVKPVVVRKKPPAARPKQEAVARRAEQAAARDPGAVIVELEMLGAASRAIRSNPAQALAYVEQHAREYPNSQLVDQRAEVRVRALCALGRAAEARAEAQRRPSGKVQAALGEGCGG